MAVPVIKMLMLPPNYSSDSDNDVQRTVSDELVPVVQKAGNPTSATSMSPLLECTEVALQPFTSTTRVKVDVNAADHNMQVQRIDLTGYVVSDAVDVGIQLYRSGDSLLPASGYVVDPSKLLVAFNAAAFPGGYPSGVYAMAVPTANGSTATTWALPTANPYSGTNESVNWVRVHVVSNGTDVYARCTVGGSGSYVTIDRTGLTFSTAKASYFATVPSGATATVFCGDHDNWMGGHMHQWPDIYSGMKDYPGDVYESAAGGQIDQGAIPCYQEPGTYRLDYQRGLVYFNTPQPASGVKADYAYFAGIKRVADLPLTSTDNLNFTVPSGNRLYPDAYQKRWVNRNDDYVPFQVKVDGSAAPSITTVSPYDELTVKHA